MLLLLRHENIYCQTCVILLIAWLKKIPKTQFIPYVVNTTEKDKAKQVFEEKSKLILKQISLILIFCFECFLESFVSCNSIAQYTKFIVSQIEWYSWVLVEIIILSIIPSKLKIPEVGNYKYCHLFSYFIRL